MHQRFNNFCVQQNSKTTAFSSHGADGAGYEFIWQAQGTTGWSGCGQQCCRFEERAELPDHIEPTNQQHIKSVCVCVCTSYRVESLQCACTSHSQLQICSLNIRCIRLLASGPSACLQAVHVHTNNPDRKPNPRKRDNRGDDKKEASKQVPGSIFQSESYPHTQRSSVINIIV
jgi:hypothetical protein